MIRALIVAVTGVAMLTAGFVWSVGDAIAVLFWIVAGCTLVHLYCDQLRDERAEAERELEANRPAPVSHVRVVDGGGR